MEQIIAQIISNFDFCYIFVVNILTYIIIKIIDVINKEKEVTTLQKRIILVISIIIVTYIYIILEYNNKVILVNSAIFAPVCWSWILRPICNKLGIGYKKIDDVLN